jgi:hypothetical protein
MPLPRVRIRKPRRKSLTLWTALCLLAAGIYFAGPLWQTGREALGSYLLDQERKQPPPPPVFTPGLTVKEFGVTTDPSGLRVVTGALRNAGRVAYPYAEVRMTLQDSTGKTIGATLAAVRDLRPGRTVAFTAPASVPDVARVTVAEVRGFR